MTAYIIYNQGIQINITKDKSHFNKSILRVTKCIIYGKIIFS